MTSHQHATSTRDLAERVQRRVRRWQAQRVRRASGGPVALAAAGRIGAGDRLVPSPVFVLSSVRSGSTLLRSVLDTHSMITAPHEMHLGDVEVKVGKKHVRGAMRHLGLDEEELHTLLWDRVLHRQLVHEDKAIVVDKTPKNTFNWQQINRAWPAARYLILLRHPAQIVRSLEASRPDIASEQHYKLVNRYAVTLHESRNTLDSHVVRYEELTADASTVAQGICTYLGVPWEPSMLNYGERERGRYIRGLGDWSENIRSGKIQPAAPLPTVDEIPAALRDSCRLLGYL